ncbi:MAG: hypothetical protein SVX43_00970 [Cyanobacteriota bacterium]|nr:hypothetical protein [Cyanobacteriota bacterium]
MLFSRKLKLGIPDGKQRLVGFLESFGQAGWPLGKWTAIYKTATGLHPPEP